VQRFSQSPEKFLPDVMWKIPLYGLSNCAERTAVFKAVSEGETEFVEIVIFADSDKMFSPCGACRQVLSEFSSDLKITIISNKETIETTITELLPLKFTLHKN